MHGHAPRRDHRAVSQRVVCSLRSSCSGSHSHRLQQHLSHSAGLLLRRLGRQQVGKPSAETVGGHVFCIIEVPQLAVPEAMNGLKASDVFTADGLADLHHQFLPKVEGYGLDSRILLGSSMGVC